MFIQTIILLRKRENPKKCSLQGLKARQDLAFFNYPKMPSDSLQNYFLLSIDGPELSSDDRDKGIVLLDGSWRHAMQMEKALLQSGHQLEKRTLPKSFRTAYPRRQPDCLDPMRGLASIEALFVAYHILGRSIEGLLDHYYWRAPFLEKNADLIAPV